MLEFFRGWRRKIGCVTLVMALVFMAGWVRSRFTFDDIELPFGNVAYGVTSMGGGLDFFRFTSLDSTVSWSSISYSSNQLTLELDEHGNPTEQTPWCAQHEIEWRWDWAGFHVGVSRIANRRDQDCMIPYWSVTAPLTALAALLLLAKPRKSSSKKIIEPSANEGP